MKPTIYELALRLAREIGWRNVTRATLLGACVDAGLTAEPWARDWASNHFRGEDALSLIRLKLVAEDGMGEGSPSGSSSGVWRQRNREMILDEAYRLATERRQLLIPRWEIAEAVGVSAGLVSIAWDGMDNLRRAVVRRAVEQDGPQSLLALQAGAIGLTA
ncbi:hypothetical protein D3C78_552900 [compost metagenome]